PARLLAAARDHRRGDRHDRRRGARGPRRPRRDARPRTGGSRSSLTDPFTLEIVKDKLAAAADEMGVVLARTSMSPIVYEVLDFACGLTDAQARVVAQTNGLTLFTGTFGPQVQSLIASYGLDGMREGDVFATNVPYDGGTHTCDV